MEWKNEESRMSNKRTGKMKAGSAEQYGVTGTPCGQKHFIEVWADAKALNYS